MTGPRFSVGAAVLILGAAIYSIVISTVLVAGIGVGTLIFAPLYLLLLPYWKLGKTVLDQSRRPLHLVAFWLTVVVMVASIAFIFRR